MKKKKLPPPDECAACGASLPRNAHACPECGADERTGWRESSLYDGLDLPDEAWADDDSDDNASSTARHRRHQVARDPDTGLPWYWTAVALSLLILLVLIFLKLR